MCPGPPEAPLIRGARAAINACCRIVPGPGHGACSLAVRRSPRDTLTGIAQVHNDGGRARASQRHRRSRGSCSPGEKSVSRIGRSRDRRRATLLARATPSARSRCGTRRPSRISRERTASTRRRRSSSHSASDHGLLGRSPGRDSGDLRDVGLRRDGPPWRARGARHQRRQHPRRRRVSPPSPRRVQRDERLVVYRAGSVTGRPGGAGVPEFHDRKTRLPQTMTSPWFPVDVPPTQSSPVDDLGRVSGFEMSISLNPSYVPWTAVSPQNARSELRTPAPGAAFTAGTTRAE
jgi:hypothetical protein